ncbi:aminoglycoside phosphotransferase family protein [Falsibacillus albus]|uniref:Aminoglycoside phosphotransferase family protein n=1 Tax=Falsibacillus albus TaxID=2478915 RepID=A0A3L7JVV8_9BACI|nr:aminoglycoside phosphotransferase family protein [Falsibacillus albus]RLQ94249.1 aminoglycoside phosphotransferase family protein [Falsibacillus albus]
MDVIKLIKDSSKIVRQADTIKAINQGFYTDEKYVLSLNNDRYLLRVGNAEVFKRKVVEFEILQEMHRTGIQTPLPIEKRILDEKGIYYTIYSFIEGDDAATIIHELNETEQYLLGIEAGNELARMNKFHAPSNVEPWYDRALRKHERYVQAYQTCGIHVDGDEEILECIENNKHLLQGRPNRFQHDDFHLGNIIVKNKKYAGAIDFSNFDWGDPVHDFVKVALFTSEVSVPFSVGQVKGYFAEGAPEDFWSLYAVYTAMSIFSSIVWVLKFDPKNTEEMVQRLRRVIIDHDGFKRTRPKWFREQLMEGEDTLLRRRSSYET